MLDEKTFKKELVRMWDSLRGDRYKGYCSCSGLSCNRCPLYKIGCREPMNTFKMIEEVEKWSKEHRPKKFKVSRLEYDILKYLSDNTSSKYITRDANDFLCLFNEKPQKNVDYWKGFGVTDMDAFNKLFQFVQWKNEEPTSIQEVLKNCEIVEDDNEKK